ncbi:hypothetical protein BV25DRAFT_1827110 [Artomyces pyxidatus]|uniref:Uncharacterized protein n=1 Tax=Artomyces pyxidatus TaxID=48021 RepID=A0ACB8SYE0_9AGAM|nr:hypothetical protein BV25DRAFT_1827110 [Artomyces pyxidatus]
MGSVCLSVVPILRCVGLSQIESTLLVVPAALEFVFSLGLVAAGKSAGRSRFILAAEGPIYFLLAVLEFLGHVLPTLESTVTGFKALDIVIGSASFLPILLFTSYIYLYKRAEIVPSFPRRFRLIANAFALVIIPFILASNELGSFLGVTYQLVRVGISGPVELAIGTGSIDLQFARSFFSSLSLVLMAIYEVATFFTFFIRLAGAFLGQRHIEASSDDVHRTILFKGTGWIAVGVKVCAIETVLGFVSGGFGIFLTRRILRMIGRACVIIGTVKGPDVQEDFDLFNGEKGPRTRMTSTRRINISGPVLVDTTIAQRISQMKPLDSAQPIATFSARAIPADKTTLGSPTDSDPLSRGPSQRTSIVAFDLPPPRKRDDFLRPPRPRSLSLSDSKQRVTVARGQGRAPTLILRLSEIDFPTPSSIAESFSNQPMPVTAPANATSYAKRVSRSFSPPMLTAPVKQYSRQKNAYLGRERVLSASSLASDSLDVVRDLSARFSGLPPRVTLRSMARRSTLAPTSEEDDGPEAIGAALLHKSSKRSLSPGGAKRKPPPEVRASMLPDLGPSTAVTEEELVESPVMQSPEYEREMDGNDNSGLRRMSSGQWITAGVSEDRETPALDAQGYRRGRRSQRSQRDSQRSPRDPKRGSSTVFDIDWITGPAAEEEGEREWHRIKSVGYAPQRKTPTPSIKSGVSRDSVAAERVGLPEDALKKLEKLDRTRASRLARKDSGVLSQEEAEYVRRTYAPTT